MKISNYLIANILILFISHFKIFAQEAKVVFSDDFVDNRNNWILQSDAAVSESITNGKLIIETFNQDFAWKTETKVDINPDNDFSISATIFCASTEKSKQFGITWGGNDENYFNYVVFASGTGIILKVKSDSKEQLTKWFKFKNFNLLNSNKLKIQKNKDLLSFYFNDSLTARIPFQSFFGNRIGFYISNKMRIEVDELLVNDLTQQGTKDNTIITNKTIKDPSFITNDWTEPNSTSPKRIELPVITLPEKVFIEPEQVTLKPNFFQQLRGLPTDNKYFESIDVKEAKNKSKDNASYMVLYGDINRVGWQMKESNNKKAFKLYQTASDKGDSIAFHRLAYFDENGEINRPEQPEFLINLTKSAQKGYSNAQYDLGIAYLNGLKGLQKDWRAAEYWLKKAANNEKDIIMLNEVMTTLGRIYFHDEAKDFGLIPRLAEAKKWLEKASDKKDLDLINTNISSISKLRYLYKKTPEFLEEVNLNIDFTNFDQAEQLSNQFQNYPKLFGTGNVINYLNTLRDYVLYENFKKCENDLNSLLKFIQILKEKKWLQPKSDNYLIIAYQQLLKLIDYTNFNEVKKFYDLYKMQGRDEEAMIIKKLCLQKIVDNNKNSLAGLMRINESLFSESWLREEAKEYMPNIIYSFNERIKSEKNDELKEKENLFKPQDEYETTAQYNERFKKAELIKQSVDEKFEKIINEFKIQLIRFSYENIKLKIQDVGTYNADNKTLPISINNQSEFITIPLQEARIFKNNINNVEVTGEKQLTKDGSTYDIFNIKLNNPVTGSAYYFGKQKVPLYLDYITMGDSATQGVPVLSTEIKFIEPSGNNILDAKEEGQLQITITNKGQGTGRMINLSLKANQSYDIIFDKEKTITGIPSGKIQTATFILNAGKTLPTSEIIFTITFTELKGFQPPPINITIKTQAFKEPKLIFNEAGIKESVGNGNNIIENSEIIDVTALIQNTGQGTAKNSMSIIKIKDPNIISTTPQLISQELGNIEAGDVRKINFSFVVNNNYNGPNLLPIEIILSEEDGLYGGIFPIGLSMAKLSQFATNINIAGNYTSDKKIEVISLSSDVDKNIPENQEKYNNRYALIIGNEDYTRFQTNLQNESNVDFARADATIFAKYAEKTLGIPPENITLITDAIGSRMKAEIEKLAKIAQYENGNAEIIFYYAGHGFPDETSKESFIIPVDIAGSNVTAGIKLLDLYKQLTQYPTKKVTVFLDACFSGGGRNMGLLSARAVKIKPKDNIINGKLVIFTASTGEQSSLPYKEKQHGMFTYFLLKKLQDSKGDINYSELGEYIKKQVQLNSIKINSKDQNPEIIFSPEVLNEWTNWKLK